MAKAPTKAKLDKAAVRAEQKRKSQRATLIRRGIIGLAAIVVAGTAGMCFVRDRALTEAVVTASYPAGQHTTTVVK